MEDLSRRDALKLVSVLGAAGLGGSLAFANQEGPDAPKPGKPKVTVIGPLKIAHGRTIPGEGWQIYDPIEGATVRGIYLDVDTSDAQFKAVPTYLTSLGGDNCHWEVGGASAVYPRLDRNGDRLPLERGFRIYLKYPTDPERVADLEEAKKGWYVNWVALGE